MTLPPEQEGQDGSGGPDMRQLVLGYLKDEGTRAALAGKRERAEEYLQQAISIDGKDPDLWALLGAVTADEELQRVCARQALTLNPDHHQAQALLLAGSGPGQDAGANPGRTAATGEMILQAADLPLEVEPMPRDAPFSVAGFLTRARLIAVFLLFLVLALDLALGTAYGRVFQDRLFPGVRIAGVDVGGLTRAQVRSLLEEGVAPSLDRQFLLQHGAQTWLFTAADLGLGFRFGEALENAFGVGREGSGLRIWWERWHVGLWGRDVPLVAEMDKHSIQAVLDQLAAVLDRPVVLPAVTWQDGQWWIAPGRDGRHIVREEAERSIVAGLTKVVERGGVGGGAVVLSIPVVTDTAALSQVDATRLVEQLRAVGQPLVLRCDELEWVLDEAALAAWIRVDLGDVPGDVDLEVDRRALQSYVTELAPQIARAVQQPRLELEGGRAVVFEIGRDGRRLDLAEAMDHVEEACHRRLSGERVDVVDLPTVVTPADENPLMAELGVAQLVGVGSSTFVGSPPDRATNIRVGGEELHGLLISPGEVFSLNAALDPITWEKGYRSSAIIIGNSVVMGLGGGLCQVATTLYRAALYSGLEIVERHPHAWRIEWYEQDAPPGFDATIALGGPDLKFRNSTGHTLLLYVETDLEASSQKIMFYGTSPGWEVSVDNVEITNWGHDVSYVRTVRQDGQVLLQETIYSHYQ